MPSKKRYGKKGTHEEFKVCEETGECESEQDGCTGCWMFPVMWTLFAPHCNDVFMHDRLNASIDVVSLVWRACSCLKWWLPRIKFMKALLTYEKRWDEKRWAGIRWEELRWDEGCSVKCGARRVQCEVWSVKYEVRSVKCEVWSVKCGLWSVKCGLWSVKCWLRRVQCEVWSVECEAWSAKWSFKCDMWYKTPVSQSARTHGLGWRTAHASSIDEKGLIYIFKATSAPPRAGTTGKTSYCTFQSVPVNTEHQRRIVNPAWVEALRNGLHCWLHNLGSKVPPRRAAPTGAVPKGCCCGVPLW